METQKTSELRVRLRRIKPGQHRAGMAGAHMPSTSASKAALATHSSDSSDDDDFTKVHFKLAAALEAAAAHASGMSFDWRSGGAGDDDDGNGDAKSSDDILESSAQTTTAAKQPQQQPKMPQEQAQHDDGDENEQQPEDTVVSTTEDEEEEDELVEMVIATCSSCSSEDEGIAELHGNIVDNVLSAVEAKTDAFHAPLSKDDAEAAAVDAIAAKQLAASSLPDLWADTEDSNNPSTAVTNILALPPFDPYAPQLKVQLIIKQIVSLSQLKQRIVDSSKGAISKKGPMSECERLAEMEFANIHVKHSLEEFFTFCSCKDCLEYREIVVHLMVDQFKAQHMVVMLVDALIKAYGPMLKNATAHNKFEKLLDSNKKIYWMTCGYIYNKMAEHMYFIYDESLSDNMILVLFSAILLVNNPLLLLQILAFHVECIVDAYAEGFLEIVDPDNNKIPAEEMLKYILDGYDDLCRISEHISCYLFAFENDFLRKFSLTWTLLCQRLYHQHVYLNLTDTMLACIITLKEEELTERHAALIMKYIQFDDKMIYVDKRWTDIWIELNAFNLSEVERKRRTCLLDVHRIFETVVQDAIEISLRESGDDNDFYDFQTLENRQLAWQNIMAYMKMKWPDGFFDAPNVLVCEDKCKSCNMLLEYHEDTCKCITCSIAGGPLPPKHNPDSTCYKCLALLLVENEVTLYESKILNVCASDDFLSFIKNNEKRKSTTLEELCQEVCSTLAIDGKTMDAGAQDSSNGTYHLAWAVFRHLNNRKRYKQTSIEEKYFCRECEFQACRLARKILNNEIAFALSLHLIRYYQPLSMSREELRSILPNIMLYNRKMVSSNIGLDLNDVHDLVVKIYWTFVISVYATYFIEFDADCALHLEYFELVNNDIKLQIEKLTGNKDDTKFVQFLNKIKGLSSEKDELECDMENSDDGNADEIKKKLEEFLKINETAENPPLEEIAAPTAASLPTVSVPADGSNKKSCKDKSKKCCFDHADFGDHCKENHSSKKRIKKECNHARMNETRDRLRKKLSQLVNARKTMKATVEQQVHQQQQHQQHPGKINQPPTLKTAASTAAASTATPTTCSATTKAAAVADNDDDSLECLNTLCKRISHLNTGKTQSPPQLAKAEAPTVSVPQPSVVNKKSNLTAATAVDKKHLAANKNVSSTPQTNKSNNNNNQNVAAATGCNAARAAAVAGTATAPPKKSSAGSGLDMVNEIYELLGTYSKDQSKVKKWINETLSYIEGSSSGTGSGGANGNGGKQPQPTNAKKAAKKAKQKQRKEEEKRIAELQVLRSQFHDIYFKEFVDKHELKELKCSKKRDKKKIAELEANVKKLQRAKAKVETAVLELIATVKQTNAEFRFSYLPTKEQQLEKIKQLDAAQLPVAPDITQQQQQQHQQQQFMLSALQTTATTAAAATNNLNATNNYSLPYAHANNFSYHIDLQSATGAAAPTSFGMLRPPLPLPTPMCYAPPQQQQLSPDVVAAMAANATANDPSKRIVTIRRVNLPNVPEPQVTVTAKGSSPDKDKLLYTFVNGQLVQTAAASVSTTPAVVAPMTQLPAPPPPPPLSKTQLKKERRRLVQAAEAEEAEKLARQQQLLAQELELQQQQQIEANLKKSKKKSKNKQAAPPAAPVPIVVAANAASTKSKKKKAVNSSASTTSVSTADALDFASTSSLRSCDRRSSSATSCSLAMASSSRASPLSSQLNTRDNSACSQKASGKKGVKLNVQQKHRQPQPPGKTQPKRALSPVAPVATVAVPPPPQSPPPTAVKSHKARRSKFVDNGQFDNNPFKSLHMQDCSSESDGYGSSSDELEYVTKALVVKPIKAAPIVATVNKTVKKPPPAAKPLPPATLAAVQKPITKRASGNGSRPEFTAHQELGKRDKPPTHAENMPKTMGKKPSKQQMPTTSSAAAATHGRHSQHPKHQPLATKTQAEHTTRTRQLPKEKQQQMHNNSSSNNNSKRNTAGPSTRFERSSNQRAAAGSASGNTHFPTRSHNNRNSNRNASAAAERLMDTKPPQAPLSKRAQKRLQSQKQQQHQTAKHNNDCYAGIPNNMGYFDASEYSLPSTHQQQQQQQYQQLKQCQQQQYTAIQQQMQGLHISGGGGGNQTMHNNGNSSNFVAATTAANSNNVSIMDQLNRGVQVENLSLPPGITLTKVDPLKSELLRKKSESIKKLAKPLQQQPPPPQSFHHPGATIIAPPVGAVSGYYGAPYAGVAAAAALGQNGVIMVDTMQTAKSQHQQQQPQQHQSKPNVAAAASNTKTTKSKKRRNKSKLVNNMRHAEHSTATPSATAAASATSGQPKMVTLRNPMFHSASTTGAPSMMQQQQHQQQQQPNLAAGRNIGGLPLAAALPMDQPAAIIKNENGMFTIRNPALQQAVANGLAMGGYRQFGNVNYYTPQEAAAEAARATQQSANENATFSYFSNSSNEPPAVHAAQEMVRNTAAAATTTDTRETHNNISISCTRVVGNVATGTAAGAGGGLVGESAIIARPTPSAASKCISAIGSEIKNAQQQKQKSIENHWSNFGQDLPHNANATDPLACGGTFRSAITNSPLQEKYQHSAYYNGFEVFPANSNSSQISSTCGRSSNTGSLFDASDCHMNHNCGDDSPPPTITGFNHYLEGIPNTGVIRYDDAAFLKTLMPGQNLNNEVSIHNVNDSNFARNAASPAAHRVDISPVYSNRSAAESMYATAATNSTTNYRDNEYRNDTNCFVPNSLLNLNELDSVDRDVEAFKRFQYDFEPPKEKQKVHININDLLINKGCNSNRTSPYMDDSALDSFVQNINSLHISAPTNVAVAATETDEQCSQLNSGGNGGAGGVSGAGGAGCKNAANGWW